jgi:hypothetical protein
MCECVVIYCCHRRSYLDLYSPYNKEEGTKIEADCGHKFLGCLECFLLQ